ncbi:MAG: hypothetical protein ABIQ88_02435 [Chitinophagaceae bacterium]
MKQETWFNILKHVQIIVTGVSIPLLLKLISIFGTMQNDLLMIKIQNEQRAEKISDMQISLNSIQLRTYDINDRLTRLEAIYQITGAKKK